jgi:IS605 OrfB family transposase
MRGLDAKESPATGSRLEYKGLCAPSARMKPTVSSLALWQGLFFAWVTLSEHKRVTSRERRRRKVARRKKGGKRRRKAVLQLQRAHVHVRNQRADFQHKFSRLLVKEYGMIAVEDLNVKGLAGGMLAKSVHDAGWSMFVAMLVYKAASAGRRLIQVDPRGTSQTCVCGTRCRRPSRIVGTIALFADCLLVAIMSVPK